MYNKYYVVRIDGEAMNTKPSEHSLAILYYSPCTCSGVALIALEEVGVPYEVCRLDLPAGVRKGAMVSASGCNTHAGI